MRRPSLKNLKFSNETVSKSRGGGLREAIIDAAQHLFLQRGFGSVSMDDPDRGGRRTLYKQLAAKEEIFREMLLRVSAQLETAFPPRHNSSRRRRRAAPVRGSEANLRRSASGPISILLQSAAVRA